MYKYEITPLKKLALTIASLLAILVVNFSSASATENLKVGVILPLTDKLAQYGDIEQKSFFMAVEEINASGGIDGKKIELIVENTKGKSDVGRSVIEKLIHQDKVMVIGGGYSSSVTWTTAEIAQQNKVPFVVNTGSADKITEQGWEYIFRINPPVSEYPGSFKTFAKEVASDIKVVAIVYMNSLFGVSESRKFIQQAENLGLKIVLKQSYESSTVDFQPLLVKVKAKKPDLVYMIAYNTEASLLMRQAKALNLNPKLFYGHAIGCTLPEFQNAAGKAVEYVWSATRWTPAAPYTGAQEYNDKFAAKYVMQTDYHGAQAYSAMYVIADALRRSKKLTREAVRIALSNTNMMTVFGPVKFVSYDKKSQQNRLPTLLVQWINGKLATVWPQKIASQKYVYPTPKWKDR
jgi:branched-chain amino acid transport system substrate-binding protein